MLSRQDVFDKVRGFYAKGGLPGHDGSQCTYFGPDGGRCAVGVLLEALEFTSEDVEEVKDEGASEVVAHLGEKLTCQLAPDVTARDNNDMPCGTFLLRLQKAHDHVAEDAGYNKWDEDLEDYGQSWDSDASGQIVASLERFARREGLSI